MRAGGAREVRHHGRAHDHRARHHSDSEDSGRPEQEGLARRPSCEWKHHPKQHRRCQSCGHGGWCCETLDATALTAVKALPLRLLVSCAPQDQKRVNKRCHCPQTAPVLTCARSHSFSGDSSCVGRCAAVAARFKPPQPGFRRNEALTTVKLTALCVLLATHRCCLPSRASSQAWPSACLQTMSVSLTSP